jgi:hypothetical protein
MVGWGGGVEWCIRRTAYFDFVVPSHDGAQFSRLMGEFVRRRTLASPFFEFRILNRVGRHSGSIDPLKAVLIR